MVVVDRGAAAGSDSSSSSGSSYEWVTDSDQSSDIEPPSAVLEPSLYKTVTSMIPFTAAYREAAEAMFELNDVAGMRRELARVGDIRTMIDEGLHDEALVELKRDTIMELGEFNKTKNNMEREGKWAFETNRQKTRRMEKQAREREERGGGNEEEMEPSTGGEGHFRKKLIIRGIFDAQRKWDIAHSVSDFGEAIDWSGSTSIGGSGGGGDTGGGPTKHVGCKWRGENDEGTDFMCSSGRLVHPWRMFKDEFGADVSFGVSENRRPLCFRFGPFLSNFSLSSHSRTFFLVLTLSLSFELSLSNSLSLELSFFTFSSPSSSSLCLCLCLSLSLSFFFSLSPLSLPSFLPP